MARIAFGIFLLTSLLYAFRWPLLEGVILKQLRKKVHNALGAELAVGHLSGSLVSSVRARNVTLLPGPASPLRAARVGGVDVRYGFLGLSGLHVKVWGLRLHLAPSDKPASPVHDTVREALYSFETAAVPATLEIEDARIVLADGAEIRVDQARLEGRKAAARIVSAGWGSIDLEAERGPDHLLRLKGSSTGGPVGEVRLDLEPGRGPDHALRLCARAGREDVEWKGTLRFGPEGKADLLQGELMVREGRAGTRVDLRSGATEIDWDARMVFEKDLAAEVTGRGRLQGSLAEPFDRWAVSAGTIRVPAARWKDSSFSAELSFSEGTLGSLPWRAWLKSGTDHAEAEGTLSLKEAFVLEARLTVRASDLSSYRGFLPEDLGAQAQGIRLEGRARLAAAGSFFEGALDVGKGEVRGISWTSIRWAGRISPEEALIRELLIEGVPAAPSVSLLGSVRRSADGRVIDLDIAGPKIVLGAPAGVLTDLVVRARVDERGVDLATLEGRLDHGPFRAIGRWDFRTTEQAIRGHLVGENLLLLSDKRGRARASPNIWISGSAERGWKVDGSIELPSIYFYGELGDPQASREGKVKEAAAPKLRLDPAPGGGFLIPGGWSGGDKVALDLELRTTREARVENSALGALLEADLRLGGTLAAPAISGIVRVRRGEVKLATGVFIRIERAEVTLPREPGQSGSIYFKGRSGKGQGAITVVIAGPLEDPALALSSDPPRKQEELLAALAFGRRPGDVSGQDALGTLAVKVFEQATDAWPKAEPSEGVWERLSLSVASEDQPDPSKRVPWQLPPTGSARGTIVRTEYLLNSFLSVVAESDREANVSGDLKIRFHFR